MSHTDRILNQRHLDTMVALDTITLLAARVRKLLSYDRRISMTQRYTYTTSAPELLVGCTLDTKARNGGIVEGGDDTGRYFGVYLRPGLLTGFGFSAYASDGNATEAEAWKRYHAGKDTTDHWHKRRNMIRLTINGGMDGDSGPARDDLIVVRAWNEHGVCEERVIGFDTAAYWAARDTEGGAS
ncbi:hypothetical protein [Micromonospora chokoriensis]|uniref:hypothetical protein n=1 Tax=Micromonospora chokoriensis TaxID=356851 RepID=UPI0004C34B51|nr:hypothetical protein [Micromonospora chokoriensis]